MAHGGSAAWNAGVLAAVEPLRDRYPAEIAFGMADAVTIQEAVWKLEERGVRRIAVVRLFISGESWYERTEQILGLRAGAPVRPAHPQAAVEADVESGMRMEFWRIETAASFAVSTQGLAEAAVVGTVLADRAAALSRDPKREDVLIIGHGSGDDAENERLITCIEARAEAVREALPFRRVQVVTLREDWPDKREGPERRARVFVEAAREDGFNTLVIPFRLHGFGPYAEVLEGLDYVADSQGLLPHAAVTAWIVEQVEALVRGPFRQAGAGPSPLSKPLTGCDGR
jgi:sirohydrochlorin ferrochelatase